MKALGYIIRATRVHLIKKRMKPTTLLVFRYASVSSTYPGQYASRPSRFLIQFCLGLWDLTKRRDDIVVADMVPDICPTNTGSQKTFKMFRKVTFANWEDPKADLLTNQMTDPMSDLMTDLMTVSMSDQVTDFMTVSMTNLMT